MLQLVAESDGSELAVQRRLRAEFPDNLVRTALLIVELRRKAQVKFARAAEMWFDRQGLEQSTGELVARHKAQRFSGEIWDLCCGVGGDALALATRGSVTAVDRNPAACLRAQWNAAVHGQHIAVCCADVTQIEPRAGLVHLDPDRRAGGRGKQVRLEDSVPGLEFMEDLTRQWTGGAIKLSPASNFGGKFPEAEVELVSVQGECKEATIWFGSLAKPESFRATVLPAGATLSGHPMDALAPLGPPARFVYDPDPAVVRAGLIDLAACQLGLTRLDSSEEYLTSETLVASPFVRAFEILAELGSNDRELRAYFRAGNFGEAEIKCRHIPIDAAGVRRKLQLEGSETATVIFARVNGRTRVLVCRRCPSS